MVHADLSARKRIILRAVRVLTAFAFILFGTLKLIGMPMMVTVFDQVGLGQWFRYATGAIEVGGAILLLAPRFVGAAALVLAATAIGAILAHLTVVPGPPAPAAMLLVLSSVIAWAYRRRTLALLGLTQAQRVSA
ncbi:DoxX family protein [Sphingomonas sp. DT-204]|uniref:DoxX family protein n=1 Tax=Sphingomonas sp. DT-204 TaxID=3396166 RepID=UPI003F1CC567